MSEQQRALKAAGLRWDFEETAHVLLRKRCKPLTHAKSILFSPLLNVSVRTRLLPRNLPAEEGEITFFGLVIVKGIKNGGEVAREDIGIEVEGGK